MKHKQNVSCKNSRHLKYGVLLMLFASTAGSAFGQARDSVYWAGVLDSLRGKTFQLTKKSQFNDALELTKQIVLLSEEKFGKQNNQTASSLTLSGSCYKWLSKYDSSEIAFESALQIQTQNFGQDHIETLSTRCELGGIYRAQSKLPQAESALLRVKSTLERTNQTKERTYRICLGNLAEVFMDKGDFDQSEAFYQEVKKIKEAQFGKESASYGATVHDMGNVYLLSGRMEDAATAYKTALEIFLNKLGRDNPYTANAYGNLGRVLELTGDYTNAEKMIAEAVSIRKNIFGPLSLEYAFSIGDLGVLYLNIGRSIEAIQLYEEARDIFIKTQNTNSQYYGINAANLGAYYSSIGNFHKAVFYLNESKDSIGSVMGKESFYYATILAQLAELYTNNKKYAEAEKLIHEELDVWEKKQNKTSVNYSSAMKAVADYYIATSNFEKATAVLEDSKSRLEINIGKDNLDYIHTIQRLAKLSAKAGDDKSFQSFIVESGERERNLIRRETNASSEKDLKNFIETVDNSSNILFQCLYKQPENQRNLSGAAFDHLIFYKGYLLLGIQQLQQAMAFADDSTRQIYTRWKGYHRQLSQQYALPIAERQNVSSLESKANTLEKKLAGNVAVFNRSRQQVGWRDVLEKLKPAEVAIEFTKFQDPDQIGSIYYAALVLKPGDSQPQFIPLFEEKELTPLLKSVSSGNNIMNINALYTKKTTGAKLKSLYELICQPLENALKDSKTVYYSPSGLLHRINLAAIANNAGQTFGDRYQLVEMGSTRQLVIPNTSATNTTDNAYLAGGIRYESDSTAVAYANRSTSSRSIEPSALLPFQPDSISITRGGVLDYLPATAAEVRSIAQTLAGAGIRAQVDTGFYATEESFRQLGVGAASPRIIHLATHGYFFPDPVKVEGRGLMVEGQEPVFKLSEHPMIRSGLIMAGAKQAWLTGKHPEGQEDGILTAYEISQMNFAGTELVVLSACETGLGDIVGNEGVFGLQRAFKIAGAKYLIMSLWKVDDKSTQDFMTTFYKHWLTDKLTVPEAFRTTQGEMRAKRPGAYDWAGFVLIE